MFPLKDNIPSSRSPYVNYLLIAANVLVFFWEMSLGPHLQLVAEVLGFIPGRFLSQLAQGAAPWPTFLPLFSSLFLHGGWLHIIGNMWFLYVFGDNVEDILGHSRYLALYLVSGVGANLVYLAFAPLSPVPLIGASGAVAGVMGAYLFLFPGAKILTLILIVFIPIFLEIPAFFFLAYWFLLQFLYGVFGGGVAHLRTGPGQMAWWAHVGGFVLGILLLYLLAAGPLRDLLQQRRQRLFSRKRSEY